MNADNDCANSFPSALLCLFAVLAIGCRSGDQESEVDPVNNFVKACQTAGLDAKLVAGFEPRASISLTSAEEFDILPASNDVLIELKIKGVTLSRRQIEALDGREIPKLVVDSCRIDVPAYLRLCELVEVEDFVATDVSFASEKAVNSVDKRLNARFINLENCGREFTVAILQSIENSQDVKATTQFDILLTLGALDRTRNLNLAGFNIDIATGGRFKESGHLESVVISNGRVTDAAISQLLLVPTVRAIVLSDVCIDKMDSIVFPNNIRVPDIHISGSAELKFLFQANCPESTLINGSPGRRASGDTATGDTAR